MKQTRHSSRFHLLSFWTIQLSGRVLLACDALRGEVGLSLSLRHEKHSATAHMSIYAIWVLYCLSKLFVLILIVFLHGKVFKIFNAALTQRLYFKRLPKAGEQKEKEEL